MLKVEGKQSKVWSGWRRVRPAVWVVSGALAVGAACSDEDAGECPSGQGPVAGPAEAHCQEAQAIGACVSAADAPAEEGEEEPFEVYNGREADDDDCKYRVSFDNTCVTLNEPVTFTLKLTRKLDGQAATGATPESPEIYLASDEDHVSPSNDITATEGPPGTYRIGPVIFDRSGRWVVRFHYFETCSDVPEDAPHGHVAFNFDVP